MNQSVNRQGIICTLAGVFLLLFWPNQAMAERIVSSMAANTVVDGMAPSGGLYPVLAHYNELWVDVSVAEQRVYIKNGDHTLYSMVMSSGVGDETPKGDFHIQSERGQWFYAARFNEGAKYWVSFQGHGQYLFHSVPFNEDGRMIPREAVKLGHPASHGCIRLSVADAEWFYDNIPYGTKVVIH